MTGLRAPFRLLRTAVVAAAVISLAAGTHILAGGQLPPAPLMAALMALTALVVVLVTKWEMTALSLAAVRSRTGSTARSLLHPLGSHDPAVERPGAPRP